jgi:hypothetical protein
MQLIETSANYITVKEEEIKENKNPVNKKGRIINPTKGFIIIRFFFL